MREHVYLLAVIMLVEQAPSENYDTNKIMARIFLFNRRLTASQYRALK